MVPLVARAQECLKPVAMAVWAPGGASVWPFQSLLPQQAMVLSVARAHECLPPAAMAVNWTFGAGIKNSICQLPGMRFVCVV